jgi:salicylate synthase
MTTHPCQHYFETRTPIQTDPLLVAACLAESGFQDEFVIYESDGQWSYAGGALAEITLDRHGARLRRVRPGDVEGLALAWDDNPLRQVDRLLKEVGVSGWRAYGWAAFELSYVKDGDLSHIDDAPLLHLIVPRAEARIRDGQAYLRAADQDTLSDLLEAVTSAGRRPPLTSAPLDVRAAGGGTYRKAVRSAVESINRGELHKVILSRVVDVPDGVDLVGTYVTGRNGNTPARSFLLNLGGVEATGFSPEIVVKVTADGHVVSQPLAGTRALTVDPEVNEQLRSDLFDSAKEIYEHAISVKVGTDELADVCLPGSIDVPEFMVVRERGSVQHLASRVSGELAPGYNAWDAFAAVFPAVTASGVPKRAAYDAIRSHESGERGLYSGAVLMVDETGEMDAALVLRSVYRQGGRAWLRAGAGIVGQSVPEREFEETCEKLDSVARYLVMAGEGASR